MSPSKGRNVFGRRGANVALGTAAVLGAAVLLAAQAGAAPVAAAATYTISIDSRTKTEGDSGTSTMVFHIDVDPNVRNPDTVSVDFATSGGTATGGEDYASQGGT